jgi:hypothetical protein
MAKELLRVGLRLDTGVDADEQEIDDAAEQVCDLDAQDRHDHDQSVPKFACCQPGMSG